MGRGGAAVQACAEVRVAALKAPLRGRLTAARSPAGERTTGEGPHVGAMTLSAEEAEKRGRKNRAELGVGKGRSKMI